MKKIKYSIANEFSRHPAGRYYTDGPFSGEKFREEILKKLLNKYDLVEILISGTMGYGSSFLEESFGGLVRNRYYTEDELKDKIVIEKGDDEFGMYVDDIWQYIREAQAKIVNNN